jgi:hypothetical protein
MNNITQSFRNMIEELTQLKDLVKKTKTDIKGYLKLETVKYYIGLPTKPQFIKKNPRTKTNTSIIKTTIKKRPKKVIKPDIQPISNLDIMTKIDEFAFNTNSNYQYIKLIHILETQSLFNKTLTNIKIFNNIDKTKKSYDKLIKLIEELNTSIDEIKDEIEEIEPLIPVFNRIVEHDSDLQLTIINGTEEYIGIKKYVDEVKAVVDDFAKKINNEIILSQSLAKMSANKLGQVLKEAPENIYQLSDENIDTFKAHYPFKENAEDEELGRRLEDGHILNSLLSGNEERIRELKSSNKLDDKKATRLLSNANVEIPEDSINTIKKYYPKAINNLLKTHTSTSKSGKSKNRNSTTRKNKN